MEDNNLTQQDQLLHWLTKQPAGAVFTPKDVPISTTPKTLTNTLALAEKQGYLHRIGTGIYQKPKKDPVLGYLKPSLEEVARAIARRDGARIIPSGAAALNWLGLSTQVPVRTVYLTDGSARVIKVGRQEIRFRPASLRVLSMKGTWSQLVVLALKELGKAELKQDTTKKMLVQALAREEKETLLHDAAMAPAWMAPVFQEAIRNKLKIPTNDPI